MLRNARPKKILEIGVAGGGTTAVMLQCLEDMRQQYEMHSVDISKPSKKLYTNNNVDTGWLGKIAAEILGSQYDYYG